MWRGTRSRWILSTVLTVGLSGCAAKVADCPRLVNYTEDQDNLIAAELTDMNARGAYPIVQGAMRDYGILRIIVKICQSEDS